MGGRLSWYAHYLLSDHWRSTREWALERAHHCCQICKSDDRVEVHHNTYDRIGHELPGDLVALCHECHGRHHGKLSLIPERDPRISSSSTPKRGTWNVLRNSYRKPAA